MKTTQPYKFVAFAVFAVAFFAVSPHTHAAVSDWQQGITIVPESTTELDSPEFQQSVQNLKNTGADFLSLVVPFSQDNILSTDIKPAWNTPTDASLISAIVYAHSLGLKVMLNFHVEAATGDWRAYIDPKDRTTWFKNYGSILKRYSKIAEDYKVEQLMLGAEMISMTNQNHNPTNTGNWLQLIADVRSVYKGTLVYSANRGGDGFYDEVNNIGFWDKLDYVGISPYYPLNQDPNAPVESMKKSWDNIRIHDIDPLRNKFNKPIIFTEIGYRSVDGAYKAPFQHWDDGNANQKEQANDYEAMLSYWNDVPYIKGAFIWKWKTDPKAGGPNNTEYTPQNKLAEGILKNWFLASTTTTLPPPPNTFMDSTLVTPSSGTAGSLFQINSAITNRSSINQKGLIVDIEVYNGMKEKVHQAYYLSETINSGASKNFITEWTPLASGSYSIQVGVFNADWSTNYFWNSSAGSVLVSPAPLASSTPPSPPDTRKVEVWWPSDGSSITGTQPFKARLQNAALDTYSLYWQVDGDRLNSMNDSQEDYPHKESLVDVSGWSWKGAGPYGLNFVAKDLKGNIISSQGASIFVK